MPESGVSFIANCDSVSKRATERTSGRPSGQASGRAARVSVKCVDQVADIRGGTSALITAMGTRARVDALEKENVTIKVAKWRKTSDDNKKRRSSSTVSRKKVRPSGARNFFSCARVAIDSSRLSAAA